MLFIGLDQVGNSLFSIQGALADAAQRFSCVHWSD